LRALNAEARIIFDNSFHDVGGICALRQTEIFNMPNIEDKNNEKEVMETNDDEKVPAGDIHGAKINENQQEVSKESTHRKYNKRRTSNTKKSKRLRPTSAIRLIKSSVTNQEGVKSAAGEVVLSPQKHFVIQSTALTGWKEKYIQLVSPVVFAQDDVSGADLHSLFEDLIVKEIALPHLQQKCELEEKLLQLRHTLRDYKLSVMREFLKVEHDNFDATFLSIRALDGRVAPLERNIRELEKRIDNVNTRLSVTKPLVSRLTTLFNTAQNFAHRRPLYDIVHPASISGFIESVRNSIHRRIRALKRVAIAENNRKKIQERERSRLMHNDSSSSSSRSNSIKKKDSLGQRRHTEKTSLEDSGSDGDCDGIKLQDLCTADFARQLAWDITTKFFELKLLACSPADLVAFAILVATKISHDTMIQKGASKIERLQFLQNHRMTADDAAHEKDMISNNGNIVMTSDVIFGSNASNYENMLAPTYRRALLQLQKRHLPWVPCSNETTGEVNTVASTITLTANEIMEIEMQQLKHEEEIAVAAIETKTTKAANNAANIVPNAQEKSAHDYSFGNDGNADVHVREKDILDTNGSRTTEEKAVQELQISKRLQKERAEKMNLYKKMREAANYRDFAETEQVPDALQSIVVHEDWQLLRSICFSFWNKSVATVDGKEAEHMRWMRDLPFVIKAYDRLWAQALGGSPHDIDELQKTFSFNTNGEQLQQTEYQTKQRNIYSAAVEDSLMNGPPGLGKLSHLGQFIAMVTLRPQWMSFLSLRLLRQVCPESGSKVMRLGQGWSCDDIASRLAHEQLPVVLLTQDADSALDAEAAVESAARSLKVKITVIDFGKVFSENGRNVAQPGRALEGLSSALDRGFLAGTWLMLKNIHHLAFHATRCYQMQKLQEQQQDGDSVFSCRMSRQQSVSTLGLIQIVLARIKGDPSKIHASFRLWITFDAAHLAVPEPLRFSGLTRNQGVASPVNKIDKEVDILSSVHESDKDTEIKDQSSVPNIAAKDRTSNAVSTGAGAGSETRSTSSNSTIGSTYEQLATALRLLSKHALLVNSRNVRDASDTLYKAFEDAGMPFFTKSNKKLASGGGGGTGALGVNGKKQKIIRGFHGQKLVLHILNFHARCHFSRAMELVPWASSASSVGGWSITSLMQVFKDILTFTSTMEGALPQWLKHALRMAYAEQNLDAAAARAIEHAIHYWKLRKIPGKLMPNAVMDKMHHIMNCAHLDTMQMIRMSSKDVDRSPAPSSTTQRPDTAVMDPAMLDSVIVAFGAASQHPSALDVILDSREIACKLEADIRLLSANLTQMGAEVEKLKNILMTTSAQNVGDPQSEKHVNSPPASLAMASTTTNTKLQSIPERRKYMSSKYIVDVWDLLLDEAILLKDFFLGCIKDCNNVYRVLLDHQKPTIRVAQLLTALTRYRVPLAWYMQKPSYGVPIRAPLTEIHNLGVGGKGLEAAGNSIAKWLLHMQRRLTMLRDVVYICYVDENDTVGGNNDNMDPSDHVAILRCSPAAQLLFTDVKRGVNMGLISDPRSLVHRIGQFFAQRAKILTNSLTSLPPTAEFFFGFEAIACRKNDGLNVAYHKKFNESEGESDGDIAFTGLTVFGAMMDVHTGRLKPATSPYYVNGSSECVLPPIKVRCLWTRQESKSDAHDSIHCAEDLLKSVPAFSLAYSQNTQPPVPTKLTSVTNLSVVKRDLFTVAKAASSANLASSLAAGQKHKKPKKCGVERDRMYRCPVYANYGLNRILVTFIDMPCEDELTVELCVERQVAFLIKP
jgi:hypothetical protein